MSNSPHLPPINIPQYTPTPVVPTMGDAEYYSSTYCELEYRSRNGDPLEDQTWGVIAKLMQWEQQDGWPPSYYIDIKGTILNHAITPDACMSDATYPYHIQMGNLTRRQRRRIARLLDLRGGRFTLRVQKWARGGFYQTGYVITGGSLSILLESVFKEFALSPPLQEFHISF